MENKNDGILVQFDFQPVTDMSYDGLVPELESSIKQSTDIIYEVTKKITLELINQRDSFIKQKLIDKGYSECAIIDERVRFPKVNRSIFEGWEYIFVDNGTKQGDFIVAIGPWECDTEFDYSKLNEFKASCYENYHFKWQDKNFDPVKL